MLPAEEPPAPRTPPTLSTPSNTITGRAAFLAVLKDEGVRRMFGNPGTTELPIMHALTEEPDIQYTMALQESVVVAMAETK